MMIVDAIRSAPTRHAVHFLVTAYIESLRHFERTCGVPAEVLELPIAGADLEARLAMLHQHTAVRVEAIVALSELASVLECAIERLSGLEENTVDALMPHARSDNPRSALSV